MKSGAAFLTYTNTAVETKQLFDYQMQDWIGMHVVVLNPTYYCDFGKKKQMALRLPEILIPIPDAELDLLVAANGLKRHQDFDCEFPKRGHNPFSIRVKELKMHTLPAFQQKACSNSLCNGRHLLESPCALFPSNKPGVSKAMANFEVKLEIPEYPKLGEVIMCLGSFARLFCEEGFLKIPPLLNKHNVVSVATVIQEALEFYKTKGFEFEIAGLGYGMKVDGEKKQQEAGSSMDEDLESAPLLKYVKATHFHLLPPPQPAPPAAPIQVPIFANKLKP